MSREIKNIAGDMINAEAVDYLGGTFGEYYSDKYTTYVKTSSITLVGNTAFSSINYGANNTANLVLEYDLHRDGCVIVYKTHAMTCEDDHCSLENKDENSRTMINWNQTKIASGSFALPDCRSYDYC